MYLFSTMRSTIVFFTAAFFLPSTRAAHQYVIDIVDFAFNSDVTGFDPYHGDTVKFTWNSGSGTQSPHNVVTTNGGSLPVGCNGPSSGALTTDGNGIYEYIWSPDPSCSGSTVPFQFKCDAHSSMTGSITLIVPVEPFCILKHGDEAGCHALGCECGYDINFNECLNTCNHDQPNQNACCDIAANIHFGCDVHTCGPTAAPGGGGNNDQPSSPPTASDPTASPTPAPSSSPIVAQPSNAPTAPLPGDPADSSDDDDGLSDALIIGISVGGGVVLIGSLIGGWRWYQAKRTSNYFSLSTTFM